MEPTTVKPAAIASFVILSAVITGCARSDSQRWAPETGQIQLTRACPSKLAPTVEEVPAMPVRAAYNFVTEHASDADKTQFFKNLKTNGFSIVPITINLNGKDTWFARGPELLANQSDVDAEFNLACQVAAGEVYLTHVQFNSADGQGSLRVR